MVPFFFVNGTILNARLGRGPEPPCKSHRLERQGDQSCVATGWFAFCRIVACVRAEYGDCWLLLPSRAFHYFFGLFPLPLTGTEKTKIRKWSDEVNQVTTTVNYKTKRVSRKAIVKQKYILFYLYLAVLHSATVAICNIRPTTGLSEYVVVLI